MTMSLPICQKIEIALLLALVRLMRARRNLRELAGMLIAILGLLISVWAVLTHTSVAGGNGSLSSATRSNAFIPVATEKIQHNTLLLVVDRIDRDYPRLKAAWLVIALEDKMMIWLAPLYPVFVSNAWPQEPRLESTFGLTDQRHPQEAFLNILHQRNLWWDHYVVLDEVGLVEWIDKMGGLDMGYGPVSGVQAVAGLPEPWNDPTAGLLAQVTMLGAVCQKSNGLIQANSQPHTLFNALSDHLSTDFTTEQILGGWQAIRSNGYRLTCQFPTLQRSDSPQ